MFYIVWLEPFSNYSEKEGDGYFVSYKDKCSNYYSKNWSDAKKYKTISNALIRLGLNFTKYITSFEKFLELNEIDKISFNRDILLSDILSEKKESKLNFYKGRIDKIDDDGNFLGTADEDIILYVNKMIENNIKQINNKIHFYTPDKYEQPIQTGVDTWEGFY
jgi:hypothetical protein